MTERYLWSSGPLTSQFRADCPSCARAMAECLRGGRTKRTVRVHLRRVRHGVHCRRHVAISFAGVAKLQDHGVRSAADALTCSREQLRQWVLRAADWLYLAVRGLDTDPVTPKAPPKTLSVSMTLTSAAPGDRAGLRRILTYLAPDIAQRAAEDPRTPASITVRLRVKDVPKELSSTQPISRVQRPRAAGGGAGVRPGGRGLEPEDRVECPAAREGTCTWMSPEAGVWGYAVWVGPRTFPRGTTSFFFSFLFRSVYASGGRLQANCRQLLANRCRLGANRWR